ncbi:hypothetical protein [Chiayiivirga flava]|uniref:Uncharacterized protein n=1 Tax=Chiayiivirga flava TaxID=659595 RepID=A0A7W8D5I5_9GAMM|nr:hypothetical protein [Chiayiivirga flava]MBB5208319.1 hypothetical protein [Chiayiivirga flava]
MLLDYVLPGAATLIFSVAVFQVPELLRLNDAGGLVTKVGGLLQVLVGFYVASLAGVATFPSRSLRQDAAGLRLDGQPIRRRKFLAAIFGYLAFLSLLLFLAGIFWPIASFMVAKISNAETRFFLHAIGVIVYLFGFWQLVFITLFGLHYLVDRMHRAD